MIMMESVDAAAGQLADTTINGQDQDISSAEVLEKRDENGSGSSAQVDEVDREEVNEVENDSEELAKEQPAEGMLEIKASLLRKLKFAFQWYPKDEPKSGKWVYR